MQYFLIFLLLFFKDVEILDYCTFDDYYDPLCGWELGGSRDGSFVRQRGPTPSLHTGPYGDHTTGHGIKGNYFKM